MRLTCLALAAGLVCLVGPVAAQPWDLLDSGKLLATGGVVEIEGAGGGGLANWALITGYGTRDGIGANLHYTTVLLPDYRLQSAGVAIGLFDRLELSYAWQEFDTQDVGAALGLGRGFTFHQNIFGAKLKLIGDAVYEQDEWLPQISIGLQHKENDRGAIIGAIGGRSDEGTDYYLSASKLFLAQSLFQRHLAPDTRQPVRHPGIWRRQTGFLQRAVRRLGRLSVQPPLRGGGGIARQAPAISPSPGNRTPGMYSPPISSTRTSRRRWPMPTSAIS